MSTLDVRLPAKVVIGNLVFILYASGLQPLEILGRNKWCKYCTVP